MNVGLCTSARIRVLSAIATKEVHTGVLLFFSFFAIKIEKYIMYHE